MSSPLAVLQLGLLLLGAPTAAAADRPDLSAYYSKAYLACPARDSESMADGACINAERSLQTARMNAAYRAARSRLNLTQRRRLAATQRAWKTYAGA